MALSPINVGTVANDGTGDTVRAAFQKVNANNALFAAVSLSGAYSDLTGKPALAAVATSGAYADLTGKPGLAPVATSGAYADLTGAPTVTKHNSTGADPAAGNDNTQGYSASSIWLNSTSGVAWTCRSAATGAAVWAKLAPANHPGLVSGRFYGSPAEVASTTVVVSANVMYAVPIQIPSDAVLSALGFSVSAAVAGTHGLIGLYSNAAGAPGALLAQPTAALSCAAATAVTGAFAANPTLTGDMYWLCAIFDGSPTMVAISGGDRGPANLVGSDTQGRQFGTGAINNHLEGASAYASGLPSTAPALALSFGNAPNLQFKAA